MESEGIDNICGAHPPPCNGANTPYMSALANNYSLGLQYSSISCSGCPTSRPNYVALLSGSNQGCGSGGCPSPITAPNLVDRFESAGLAWKGYFENQIISGQPFQGCDTNSNSEPYNPQHNPFVVFQDITNNSARCSNLINANPSTCAVTDCALINDLNSASAPNFMWLTPNDCNDMHGASICANCPLNNGQSVACMQGGDNYLKSLVPNILKSNTFTTTRSALFITYDEGLTYCPGPSPPIISSSEDCVYSVLAGPQAKNNFNSTNPYNHYSFTKTIETNWSLPSLAPGGDGKANPMTEFFKTQPDFAIAVNPSSLTFSSGSSGSFTATVSPVSGFTGTVTLTTTTSSTGLIAGCNPTSISRGSGTSTCTVNSSNPGSYTVTVTGSNSSLSHSAKVSVTVNPPSTPDFSISANPTSLTITKGSSETSTISLASLNSFSGTISLSALVSPSGPSVSLNPSTVTLSSNGAGSSTLNVTTAGVAVGSYYVNVTGTSSSLSHSVKVNVSVNGPADFAISANPNSLTLGQGSSSTMTPVTVTTSGDRTWFESSYLASSFYAQGLIWLFFEDSSKTCENLSGCLLYTTSSTGSTWATPTNLAVHVTDSDFSVFTDGTNVYYARYDEFTYESNCGKNIQFRTGSLVGSSGTISWQAEQTALKGASSTSYPDDEITVDSNGQVWIAFMSASLGGCGGNGNDLPQIIHSSGTNYGSWSSPFTLCVLSGSTCAGGSSNWHLALASLGSGQIYAAYWLSKYGPHGRLYNGTSWGPDEQISSATSTDVNNWLFNSGTSLYMIYFDSPHETFNFATRSSSGTWTSNTIDVGEAYASTSNPAFQGCSYSPCYYSLPDAASYDPTHGQFYLFWMNSTLQRIDEWKGAGSSWTKTTNVVGTTAVPYPDSISSFITSSPTNSFPTTGGIFYVSGSSAPFTYNFVALPLSGISTGTFTVTITSQNSFAGTVNLSTSISPSTGLTVNCNPTIIRGGSGSSTCTVTGSTAGNYNVTVTGTSGSLTHSTRVSVSVQTSSPDFTISSSPTNMTFNAGVGGASTISVAPLNGFTGTVNLSATTNSTSLSCKLSSTTITGASGSVTLSCNSSTAGNYLATVTGTSGALSHSTSVTYHVQDFSVIASPTTVSTTVNAAGTATVSVVPINGFTGAVSLATTTNSTNLVCSLTSTTIAGGSGTSTLSCSSSIAANYFVTVTGTSATLSHSAGVVYHVTNAPDFTMTASPTIVTMNAGIAGNSTIAVAPLNGFSGTVTLVVTTNSTNLSCSFSSTSITGGSGTSALSCQGSPPGNYLATVTGTSGSLSHSATVKYQAQDFIVTANPSSVSTRVSVSAISTITVAPLNGFTGAVALSVTTNSTSLSCSLSSSSIMGGSGTSTLSCTGSVANNYLATVTGSNRNLSHSTAIVYRVTATQDFTLNANPTIVALSAGSAGNSTITVAPVNGFADTVALAVTTNSTGLVCTLTQTTISGGSGSSTLSCAGSPAGNYLATITGTSGTLSHSTTVTYYVQDFTMSASPTIVNESIGVAGNSTITVAPLNGFTGSILLAVTTNSTNLVCTLSPSSINGGSGTSTLSCNGSLPGGYLGTVTGTDGGRSHSVNVTYNVTILVQDFTISANPSTVTVNAGVAGNSTITVSSQNGFIGTVTLTVTPNSTNLACTLSPATITGGSGNSILSCGGPAAGNYGANVTGTSGTLSHSATVTYHVQDFAITANPSDVSTGVGVTGSSTISVASINGFSGVVSLAVTTNSTGLSCTLGSAAVPGGSGTSMLRCTGSALGNYFANVTGSSGALTHAKGVTFKIVAPPDFGLTVNPTSISGTTGSPGLSTITVASMNGFMGTVILGITTTAPSLSCSLSSTTISGGSGTSNLSCTSNVAGSYVANVTGKSGSLSHSATVTYQITAAPDFSVSANPTSLTIGQGSSGTSAITVVSLNGFSGTVTLSASVSPLGPSTSLNPGTVTLAPNGAGSSTLNVTSVRAPPGTYKVNVTATSGSLSHSFLITVTITSTSVSPTYALVVSYEGFVYKLYPNGTLSLIGQPVTTQLRAVSWKPDGSYAVIVGDHAVLIKYDGTSFATIPTGIATTVNFLSISWRPDGSYALVGGSGGILLKYDGTMVTQIPSSYAVSFRAISWNPSGAQALLVTYFGQVFQYQSTGQLTKLASGASQSFDAVAWSPDGAYALIAGDGGGILKYDGTTFQALNTAGLYSSTLTVRYISFNPASNLALLVGDSGLVLTYNGSSLSALPTLTSNTLYSVSWAAGTAYIAGGAGTMLTYSGGTLKNAPTGTFSGFRGIAWKPN